MGNQTIGQWACAAVSVLAVLGCAPGEEADDGDIVTTQSALVAALPAFPYDSLPVEIKNVATGKCLTWTATTSGNPARQSGCTGSKSSMWFLIKATATTYQLRPGNLGWRVLGVTGGSSADGAAIEVSDTGSVTSNEAFSFDSQTGGSYRIQTFASKCVEVQNADPDPAALIRQAACTTQNRQRWQITPKYVNFSFVTSAPLPGAPNEHLCMDVANASQGNGAVVQQWWCSEGAAHQRWSLAPGGTVSGVDYYSIKSTNSNKCIDIPDASTQPGVQAQQYDCHGGDNQLWSFSAQASDGRLMIKNKHSGLCLKVGGSSVAVNGPVIQESCGGTAARWHYTHVVRRHVGLIQLANNDGSNLGTATNSQVDKQLGVVKNVYEQWGVNLLFDPATDRVSPVLSTHMNTNLRSTYPPAVATCWSLSPFSGSAADCATTYATVNFPSKVVIFELTDLSSGFSAGSQNWIKSMPVAGAEICAPGTPTVYDDVHWAHEFGHYMGLSHVGADNDLLADTPIDSGSECVDPRTTTNPLTTNIMTYHYNLAHQISPNQAKIVRQTAFARWY